MKSLILLYCERICARSGGAECVTHVHCTSGSAGHKQYIIIGAMIAVRILVPRNMSVIRLITSKLNVANLLAARVIKPAPWA